MGGLTMRYCEECHETEEHLAGCPNESRDAAIAAAEDLIASCVAELARREDSQLAAVGADDDSGIPF